MKRTVFVGLSFFASVVMACGSDNTSGGTDFGAPPKADVFHPSDVATSDVASADVAAVDHAAPGVDHQADMAVHPVADVPVSIPDVQAADVQGTDVQVGVDRTAAGGTCATPLNATALAVGATTSVSGDNTAAANATEGTCAQGSTGGEQVVKIHTPAGTLFQITATTATSGTPDTTDTVLYARTVCDDDTATNELACNDDVDTDVLASQIVFQAPGDSDVFIFVDSFDDGSGDPVGGPWQLDVNAILVSGVGGPCDPAGITAICASDTPLVCAGAPGSETCQTIVVLGLGAACDPTNPAAVCDTTMALVCAGTPGSTTCQSACDAAVVVAPGASAMGTLDPTATGAFAGSCSDNTATHDERVFSVTVPATTPKFDLVASTDNAVTDGTDTVVYVRSVCADATTEVACDDDGGTDFDLTSFAVAQNLTPGTYFVFVDLLNGGTDPLPFQLDVSVRPVLAAGAPCDPSGVLNRCDDPLTCGTGNICAP